MNGTGPYPQPLRLRRDESRENTETPHDWKQVRGPGPWPVGELRRCRACGAYSDDTAAALPCDGRDG